jgi:hypothetical protein
MASALDVQCPTCSAVTGVHCLVVRLSDSQQGEVVVQPVRRLPGSPHMARRLQARAQARVA